MGFDRRPFPKNLRVAVRNDNQPEPGSTDKFSGFIQLQYDGELYDFPPNEFVVISPEAAFHMYLWDCRTKIDRAGREELDVNGVPVRRDFRDTISTGAFGNSGIGQQATLYMQRLLSLGWANDSRKAARFEKFTFKTLEMNSFINQEVLNQLAAHNPIKGVGKPRQVAA